MKLALHRSIIFWSGLLVMAFVCWAWYDSEHLWTKAGKGQCSVHHGWGGVTFSTRGFGPDFHYDRRTTGDFRHSPETFPAPFMLRTRDVSKEELAELSDRFVSIGSGGQASFTMREFMTNSVGASTFPVRVLFIPHWLILLTLGALWLGLLFWRARRRNKTATIP